VGLRRLRARAWEQGKPWSITEGEINNTWLDQGDRRQRLEEHLQWLAEEEQLRRDIAREREEHPELYEDHLEMEDE
jgi:hypothetical protein